MTICTQDSLHLFGGITNDEMVLNDSGMMIEKWWNELKNKFPNIELNEFVVTPNHFHGIIQIINTDPIPVGADLRVCPDVHPNASPDNADNRDAGKHIKGEHIGSPLHTMIQWFKTMSTNEYIRNVKNNHWPPFNKKLWQRNYYEHIIRNEKSYSHISEYIKTNPLKWLEDKYYG
ncbi:MAG: transposase [Candidatus Scalindua sp.]